jgi:hypothetical protein
MAHYPSMKCSKRLKTGCRSFNDEDNPAQGQATNFTKETNGIQRHKKFKKALPLQVGLMLS